VFLLSFSPFSLQWPSLKESCPLQSGNMGLNCTLPLFSVPIKKVDRTPLCYFPLSSPPHNDIPFAGYYIFVAGDKNENLPGHFTPFSFFFFFFLPPSCTAPRFYCIETVSCGVVMHAKLANLSEPTQYIGILATFFPPFPPLFSQSCQWILGCLCARRKNNLMYGGSYK